MTELYLSLGSNLGDRKANIIAAIRALGAFFETPPSAISTIKEYKAWGFDGQDFLNCAVRFDLETGGASAELYLKAILKQIKSIEREQGRDISVETDAAGGRIYHDRPLDIDILFFGKTQLNTDELTVPHRLISQRDFVLEPLREIASETLKQDFPLYFQYK